MARPPLDASKDVTAIRVYREDGRVVRAGKVRTEPNAILVFLQGLKRDLLRVIPETGRMAN